MIPQSVAAILLAVPLGTLVIQSFSYWSEFRRSEKKAESTMKAGYRKPYFHLLVFGVLCMWLAWLGGMVLLFLNKYDSVFGFQIFQSARGGVSPPFGHRRTCNPHGNGSQPSRGNCKFLGSHSAVWMQVGGFIIFYLGAVMYNLTLFVAGKYLRPAPSGIHEEHKLIQEGPYGIIRHPLYVSYILILAGLSLVLRMYWLLIPTICIIVGIYPTAKAEEEMLVERFGEEYMGYKRRVGMLFPRLF